MSADAAADEASTRQTSIDADQWIGLGLAQRSMPASSTSIGVCVKQSFLIADDRTVTETNSSVFSALNSPLSAIILSLFEPRQS